LWKRGQTTKYQFFQEKQDGGSVVHMTNALRVGVSHMIWLFLKMELASVYIS